MRPSGVQWREGTDGGAPVYTERLLPAWWVWLTAAGFVAMVAIAYGYAFSDAAGWLVAASGGALAVWWLLGTTAVVRIDDRVLRVGRARLPLVHVGRVVPLDGELSAQARSTRLDPRAHLLLRTTTCSTCVMVEVDDPDDPHPYWLFSTKHPEEVASALQRAVEESQGASTGGAHGGEGSQ